jgi:hypothetical protein
VFNAGGSDGPYVDNTEVALRRQAGIEALGRVLRDLEAFEPHLVENDIDATLGTRMWPATNAGGDAL